MNKPDMTSKGFTLIETLLVIAIAGILITMAYPTYVDYIARVRRVDGKTALIDLANRLEHYYAIHHSYQSATLATGKNTDVQNTNVSPEGWYTLSIVSQTATTYELKATAQKAQAFDKIICQELTLNHLGIKGTHSNTGSNADLSACW
ncbi:Type-IV pilin [Legionella donaldsonii]|uniref:Type-IV pilin n=1 Tax=Legionella donaldsonii TaxID=45060 RepID=A0A378J5P2_9GAMM|nr:type IV pilin protein [Legionella donaldsonii]STX43073.1 Type-IV pilin [Legionella donaldsonii]